MTTNNFFICSVYIYKNLLTTGQIDNDSETYQSNDKEKEQTYQSDDKEKQYYNPRLSYPNITIFNIIILISFISFNFKFIFYYIFIYF